MFFSGQVECIIYIPVEKFSVKGRKIFAQFPKKNLKYEFFKIDDFLEKFLRTFRIQFWHSCP